MTEQGPEKPQAKTAHAKAVKTAAAIALAVSAAALLYFSDPSSSPLFPPCPTEHFLGFYCPGCGSLRAVHAALHLDFREAFSQNPLMLAAIPLLLAMAAFPQKFTWKYFPLAVLIVLLSYTAMRNIGIYPFTLLAPH